MAYTLTTDQLHFLQGIPNAHARGILRALFEGITIPAYDKYTLEEFRDAPTYWSKLGKAATGTAGDENAMQTERNAFEYHIIGTQTLLSPAFVATGLDIGMDQAAADGVELTQGITSRSRMAFTVGTHTFYARCKFSMSDVTDCAEAAFGFRKAEAYQAAIDDYDEMACFNIQAGVVNIETIDNGVGTVTTDTTLVDWVDAATHEVTVHVDGSGNCTFEYDGAQPTVTKVLAFDLGEVVVPFFYMLLGGDGTGDCILQEWEVGLE